MLMRGDEAGDIDVREECCRRKECRVAGALAATSTAGWTPRHDHVHPEGSARIKWER